MIKRQYSCTNTNIDSENESFWETVLVQLYRFWEYSELHNILLVIINYIHHIVNHWKLTYKILAQDVLVKALDVNAGTDITNITLQLSDILVVMTNSKSDLFISMVVLITE